MTRDPYLYLENLPEIFKNDVEILNIKDRKYASSWKKRGGVGAYFTLIRKLDALENMVDRQGYNIFRAVAMTGSGDGSVLDQIQDLRRYLALVEAELRQRAKDGDTNFTAIFGGPAPTPAEKAPEPAQERGEAAVTRAIAQHNGPPTVPEGMWDQLTPLITPRLNTAYSDCYGPVIPFRGDGVYYQLKTILSWKQWRGIPSEWKLYYHDAVEPDERGVENSAYLKAHYIDQQVEFAKSFRPGGSNYSPS